VSSGNPLEMCIKLMWHTLPWKAARALVHAGTMNAWIPVAAAVAVGLPSWWASRRIWRRPPPLTEAELARDFASPEALRSHLRLARFVDWVRKRPPHFLSRVPKGRARR